jgi:hypothetical protein
MRTVKFLGCRECSYTHQIKEHGDKFEVDNKPEERARDGNNKQMERFKI